MSAPVTHNRAMNTADTPRSALLIVDTQVGVMKDAHESGPVLARIDALVQRAREHGTPVWWVQHRSEGLVPDTPAWQFAPPQQPAAGESVVHKRFNSSFAETQLHTQLQAQGITRLVLAGAMSNWCIRATAFGAIERGYDLALASDAHTTAAVDFGNGRGVAADALIDELNVGLKWLAAPGVHIEVAPSAAISF
jgi:nicotinamidase-related amidase